MKRLISFVTASSMLFSGIANNIDNGKISAATTETTARIYGDVTNDGKLDVLDSISLTNYVLNSNKPISSNFDVSAADLDGDGVVNTIDAILMKHFITNSIDIFPIEANIDSDGDGLYDFQEVNFKSGLMQFAQDGSVILPSLEQIAALNPRSKNGLDKIILNQNDLEEYLRDVLILIVSSNPEYADSDQDGLFDLNDPSSSSDFNNSSTLTALSIRRLDKIERAYIEFGNSTFSSFEDQRLQETKECITNLQKGLEYIGYLDMGGATYGRFGGATQSAVILYQLNHRLYVEDQMENQGIDKTTYYSILRSAMDYGMKYDNVLELSVKNYFKNTYIPQSVPLDNSDYPVVKSEKSKNDRDIYIYDFTKPLEGFLKYGAIEFHKHYFTCNINDDPSIAIALPQTIIKGYSNSQNKCMSCRKGILDYPWMIEQVKDDGKYDVKREKRWINMGEYTNSIVPYYHTKTPFIFDGMEINAEIFGNILFGYIGNAGGFSKLELVGGGSIYSLLTTQKLDNKEDGDMVKNGYERYDVVKNDYMYIHGE